MTLRVQVIGRPNLDEEAIAEFLMAEGTVWRQTEGVHPAENIVEFAGRICYMSFGKDQSPRENLSYIRNLIVQGHESVLEHANWTFLLAGVSRALTHQLVRHRAGFSFSQLSQQYHEEVNAEFVVPEHLAKFPEILSVWKEAMTNSRGAYRQLLTQLKNRERQMPADLDPKEMRRAIRSAARSVLPNASETKLVFTANARALRHFLKVRGAIPGDVEMRRVCAAVLTLLKKEAPALFADLKVVDLSDQTPSIAST